MHGTVAALVPLVLLLLFLQLFAPSLAQLLDLDEGEACRRWWGVEWTCRRISDCPEARAQVRNRRPVICSFQGTAPVVCCPPTQQSNLAQTKKSKAKEYCEKMHSTCGGSKRVGGTRPKWEGGKPGAGWGQRWSPGWGAPARAFPWRYRFKRQFNSFTEEQRPSIIGGVLTFARTRPYMALIGYGSEEDKQWNCGGSLVSEKYVLSAAHCSESQTQGPAKWVLLGELDLSTNKDDARPEEFTISRRVVHPEYKEPAIYNDLALFELERVVKFSQWIRPVCLHTTETISALKATATGWGRTDFVGETSPQLMEVDLTLVGGEECKRLLEGSVTNRVPDGILPEKMVCAGERQGGKDTCAGDSGGPLVVRQPGTCLYSQIGLTSFGRQCALPNSPGVYTRISFYVSWIESVIWP